jgi:hypothetical protein
MKITIRCDKNYGVETFYPACERAQLFARIAGTKTLTRHALRDIAALGIEIEIEQTAPKTFSALAAAH